MPQLRLTRDRMVPKPHPIRDPLNAQDIDFNFDLLYKTLAKIKDIFGDILSVAQGGTGLGSYLRGDLIVATDTTVLGTIHSVTTGNVLVSQGILEPPIWSKVKLVDPDSHVTGLTSKGDIVVYDGTSYSRLPAGSNGKVLLSSGSSSLGLEWGSLVISIVDPGAGITGFTSKGDLLTYSGSAYVRLPVGADGTVLHASSSTSPGLEWRKVDLINETTGLTSKGDLLVYNGSTYSILPRGSDGQYLLSSGSSSLGLEWATVTPGGGPVDTSASEFLVLSTNSLLTNERRLVGTANRISITDGGAGNDATLSTPQDLHTGAAVQFSTGTFGEVDATTSSASLHSGSVGQFTAMNATTATIGTRASVGTTSLDSSASLHVVGQYYSRMVDAVTISASTCSFDWSLGNEHKGILTTASTISFTNAAIGGRYVLLLKQDSTGSRTVTWPGTVLWPVALGTPTLSTTGSKTDLFTFFFDGTNYFGNASLTH